MSETNTGAKEKGPTGPLEEAQASTRHVWGHGIAEPGSAVALLDTQGYIVDTTYADDQGEWKVKRSLFGGSNVLYAETENAYGVGLASNYVTVRLVPEPPLYEPVVALTPTIKSGDGVTFRAPARDDNVAEGPPTKVVTATLRGTDTDIDLDKISSTGPVGTWEKTQPVTDINNGDWPVDFVGIDEQDNSGHGETSLIVKSPPPASIFDSIHPTLRRSGMLDMSGTDAAQTARATRAEPALTSCATPPTRRSA